ncbi:MAG: class D beta-lactamase [Pararhodobacter sp.]|nr:class D beta-lactamase [Pararhodobacter sp.]
MSFNPKTGIRAGFALLAIALSFSTSLRAEVVSIEDARGCEQLVDSERSTFVMVEIDTGRMFVCNEQRASERFFPASTFKIPHTLIALESGESVDVHAALPWDGRPRGVGSWDQDTSLSDAITSSTVWVFQDIAERIGHARELEAVQRLQYGNADIGDESRLRSFWLSGPLEISALEQISFLSQLRERALDVDPDVQMRTIDLLSMQECGRDCMIYGKTGAVLPIDNDGFLLSNDDSILPPDAERTGWFVGWVERPSNDGGPVVFAHNLDLSLPGAMAARIEVTYAILAENDALNEIGSN